MRVSCLISPKSSRLSYLSSVHDSLPDQARPMWQHNSLGSVTGVEGAVQTALTGAADSEGHQAGVFRPVCLTRRCTMPSHGPTIHEAAPPQLWPSLSARQHCSSVQGLAVAANCCCQCLCNTSAVPCDVLLHKSLILKLLLITTEGHPKDS